MRRREVWPGLALVWRGETLLRPPTRPEKLALAAALQLGWQALWRG